MTGATMFSGTGAPETALPEIDWRWCAEIEKFPAAVIKHHHPDLPNLGDVTASDFIERALTYGPLEILVAGSPCQAFSVAGNRQSLSDDRGNLTLRLVEVVRAINPRFLLWENVPGVLSTKDNAFGCFLGALVGSDAALVPARGQRWTDAGLVDGPERTSAWRILDAQHFKLAQRRRRVFVLSGRTGDFGVAKILFESESLRRHTPASREAREDVADGVARSLRGRSNCTHREDSDNYVPVVSGPIGAQLSKRSSAIDGNGTFVTHSLRADGFDASEDGTGRGTPLVPVTLPTLTSNGDAHSGYRDDRGLVPIGVTIHGTDKTASVASFTDIAGALRARAPGGQENSSTTAVMTLAIRGRGDSHELEYREDGIANAVLTPNGGRAGIGVGAAAFDTTQITSKANYSNPKPGDPCHPLASGAHPPAVAVDCYNGSTDPDTTLTLRKGNGNENGGVPATIQGMKVRRLTPTECERLQGFPDSHTALPGCADGPRYKSLGNSMAVPVIRWIGRRIMEPAV